MVIHNIGSRVSVKSCELNLNAVPSSVYRKGQGQYFTRLNSVGPGAVF